MTLAFHVGPIGFEQASWLLLAPACWALIVLIGRQTLSGMGTSARRVAMLVRIAVVLLIAAALARPQWRREGEAVNVVVVTDVSESVRRPVRGPGGKLMDLPTLVDAYMDAAADGARRGDTVSRVTVARKAYVQNLPAAPRDKAESLYIGATDGTNLAEGVNVGLAIPATDVQQRAAAKRMLVISDFQENAGSLLQAAQAARAAGVPVDVLPLRYSFDQEVIVERLVTPATARMGQNVVLRVLLSSLKPASGRLTLLVNGEAVQLGPTPAETAMRVDLQPGPNVVQIPVALPLAGPQRFEAVFVPDDPAMDSIAQNNRSLAVTFVQSEGRVLVIAESSQEVEPLMRVLQAARLAAELRRPTEAPRTLVDWGAYDAVVLANASSAEFNQQQQEDLRAYVHDLGGGLVMIGGPDAFGSGGWIGSPVADALPVKLDPPQQRKMPRGALVLLMHSCEMPRGNYWGQQVALAAVNNLSRQDLAGVLEFSFAKGDWWVHPLSEVGSRAALTRAINSLTFGDMPSFDNLLGMAFTALQKADAGARHIIIISDGDPQLVNKGLLDDCKANRISISTVLVYPHSRGAGMQGADWATMREIAQKTGGNFHPIIDEGEFAKLPSIFIKEAQVVKRSLIWEGTPFSPKVVDAGSEPMRGLTASALPPVGGYIVTADREGLSVVSLRGMENDPILAHWQYGLGKSVAFTSDASVRWATRWPSWAKYRAFWEQHVRWAMRPGGSADMRVSTEDEGDRTRVVVEALDPSGERLNFVRFVGRVVGPDGKPQNVELRQTGPGRYEGHFESVASGAYVANLRYLTPGDGGPSGSPTGPREGNLQVAVSRPYADEFRTLKDNAPLGKAVAELTGGREVDPDPRRAQLWLRSVADGSPLKMPVDSRPIWLLVALLAVGLFLVDVAVRRVRIDPEMVAALLRRGMGRGAQRANQQLGSLKEARQRAQQGMSPPPAAAAPRPAPPTAADRQTAKAKFDLSDAEVKAAKSTAAPVIDASTAPSTRPGPGAAPTPGAPPPTQEQGLSRLKKARERAQEKFEEPPNPPPSPPKP